MTEVVRTEPALDVPGPGTLHWRYAGEVRGYLLLVKAGLLQLMHPGLGAGVEHHSDFFNEPWERVLRSVPEIQGVTFDWPHGERTARKIRDYHTHIKGTDAQGRRYHALDPETYFWAHATIWDALFQMIDLFDHPTEAAAMGAAGRERVRGHFSTEVMCGALDELYSDLVGQVVSETVTDRKADVLRFGDKNRPFG